ncbi:MAG: UDP-N-acetylmuramoyl-L-alanyl-D-glutamate--2,6-diaminopimelate ligase [Ignavibacteria bacterium]
MELSRLVNSLKVIQLAGEVERKDIESIAYDSRVVKKNTLFVAISGFNTDGHKFILDAINKGATAVVLENNDVVPEDFFLHRNVTKILVRDSRQALSEVSNAFFKEPTQRLQLIGITGTKGKTTTSYFIKNIIENAGCKTGLIGTIANYIGNEPIYTSMTTPESSDLNQLFARMLSEGCSHCIMEVSSHSLVLKRVSNINFQVAVFTNLASDHLDFHITLEEYLKAKKILFDTLSENTIAIYNADDKKSYKLIADTKAKTFSYGTQSGSDFLLKNINYDLTGTSFDIEYDGKSYSLKTGLIGAFNALNATTAFAVCTKLGFDIDKIVNGINTTPQIPGRFEIIQYKDKKVIVDYSHTADSLDKALQAIHTIVQNKRPVYTVFGCGGNRDKTKRPVMGRIAGSLSKRVIITSDNPRNEDPMEIIRDIINGIDNDNYEIIEDREKAIYKSIKDSEENAVILIAGKGHENYQEIKGVRSHFSDKETAEKYLKHE